MRTSARVMLWVVPGLLVVGIGAAGWFVGAMTPYRRGLLEARPAAVVEYDPKSEAAERDALPWPDEIATTTVSGTVLRRGAAVAGARVRLFETIVPQQPYGGAVKIGVVSEAVPTRALREISTDTTGAWRLEGVAPGRYCIAAGPADDPAAACAARVFVVPPGGVPIREDLALPDGTASVAVRVTGFDGRPFAGRVALRARPFLEAADVFVVADCDDNGRATLSGLSLPTWSLWALSDDGAERGPDVAVAVTGEKQVMSAAIDLAAGLRRITVDCIAAEDGTPVRGVVVRVRDGIGERVVRAGDDGRAFTYAGWGATVTARAPGRPDWMRGFDGAVPTEPITLRVPRAGVVAGTVVDDRDDAPVAGTVVWAGEAGDPDTPHARTAADGSFRIEGCAPGRVKLSILGGRWTHAPGDVQFREVIESTSVGRAGRSSATVASESDSGTPRVEVVSGEVTAARLHAQRAGRFVGRVVDAEGRPAAGARLVFGDRSPSDVPRELVAVSGPDGRFTTSGVRESRTAYCAVWTPGVAPQLRTVIALGDDGRLHPGTTRDVTVSFPSGRTAFARILNESGVPQAGVAAVIGFRDTVDSAIAIGVSDANGLVRFDGVPVPKVCLEVVAVPRGGVNPTLFDLTSLTVGTEAAPLKIELRPTVLCRGVVLSQGAPVAGAVVANGWAGHVRVRTGDRGEFELPMPYQTHVLIAAFAPSGKGIHRAQRAAADESPPITVELAEAPVAPAEADSGSVVVIGPDGRRVSRFRWMDRVVTSPGSSQRSVSEFQVYAMRDDAGALLPLAPATIQLADDAPKPREIRVERGDGGLVGGRVVDTSGAPLAGAVVALFWAHQAGVLETKDAVAVVHSAADGSFTFRGMPGGALVLRVLHRRSGAVGSVPVPAAGPRTALNVTASADGGVSILVLDPFQRALPGADVTIDVVGGGLTCLVLTEDPFSGIVRRTGPDGIARFPEIPPSARCRRISVTPRYPTGAGLSGFTQLDWSAEDATIRLH